jgi:hypothetical protein
MTPPRNAADFLELAENGVFLDRKRISALNETNVEPVQSCTVIFSAALNPHVKNHNRSIKVKSKKERAATMAAP